MNDTIQRDFRCPFRWTEDGKALRCDLPDAHEHVTHVSTEPARPTRVRFGGAARDFDFDG